MINNVYQLFYVQRLSIALCSILFFFNQVFKEETHRGKFYTFELLRNYLQLGDFHHTGKFDLNRKIA